MNQVTINPYIFAVILGALFIAFCLTIVFYRGMQHYRRESSGLLSQLKNNIERLNEASSKIVSLEKTIEQKENPENKTSHKFSHVLRIGYYGNEEVDVCAIGRETDILPEEMKSIFEWFTSKRDENYRLEYIDSKTNMKKIHLLHMGSVRNMSYAVTAH